MTMKKLLNNKKIYHGKLLPRLSLFMFNHSRTVALVWLALTIFGVGLSASRAIPFVPSTSALSPTKRAGRKTAEPVSLRLDAIVATSEARKPTGFVESSPRRVGNSTSLTVADTGSPQQESKLDISGAR